MLPREWSTAPLHGSAHTFFKERATRTIPPWHELRAMVGVDAYRRDRDTVLHTVIKEPFTEYCGGSRGFLLALAYSHRSCGTRTGGYLLLRDIPSLYALLCVRECRLTT